MLNCCRRLQCGHVMTCRSISLISLDLSVNGMWSSQLHTLYQEPHLPGSHGGQQNQTISLSVQPLHVLQEGFLLCGLAARDKVTFPRPTMLQHTAACRSCKSFSFRPLVLAQEVRFLHFAVLPPQLKGLMMGCIPAKY